MSAVRTRPRPPGSLCGKAQVGRFASGDLGLDLLEPVRRACHLRAGWVVPVRAYSGPTHPLDLIVHLIGDLLVTAIDEVLIDEQARKKAELQAKQTRSAKQLLKKRARREARHATHINHMIAKTVVAVPQRTERGLALEQLQGIREGVTVSRDQRARQSSWPFHQLGAFFAYKAKRAGVPFIVVDPAYTSQRCPRCGHTEQANRPTRDHFHCRRCGLAGPADHVAGADIAQRGATAWVFVNMPDPAPYGQGPENVTRDGPVVGDSREHKQSRTNRVNKLGRLRPSS
jgi:IS605 OrfB family transposase